MVQDTSRSPEMYLSSISAKEPLCGGWGIENEVAPEEEHDGSALTYETENLRDRTVVWAVNIPGEAPWCALSADPNWAPSTGMPLINLGVKVITDTFHRIRTRTSFTSEAAQISDPKF